METPTNEVAMTPIVENNNQNGVYSSGLVLLSALFGGVLAECYLISKNYETLGQSENAKQILRTGIVLVAIIPLVGIFVSSHIQNLFTGMMAIIAYMQFYSRGQGKLVSDFLANGGKKNSFGKVLLIILFSFLITLAYLDAFSFVYFLLTKGR